MATIRKKGDYQWHVQIRRKHIKETRTFTTKAEAERWSRDIENKIDRGIYLSSAEAESTTFAEACDRYLEEILPGKKGYAQDASRLKIVKAALGKLPLALITGVHLTSYKNARLLSVGNQSVIHELNLINRVLKSCTLDWHIHLPAGIPQVRKPETPEGRDRLIEDGEIDEILNISESAELAGIVYIALETAMRRQELTRLTWDRLDFSKRVFVLRKDETKNGAGRGVPLSTAAINVLKTLPRLESGKVFSLKKDSISQAFGRAVSRAREAYVNGCEAEGREPSDTWLMDIHFHDLRHTATTRLAKKIQNVIELASITGHKDLQSLKRYYHPNAEELAEKLA